MRLRHFFISIVILGLAGCSGSPGDDGGDDGGEACSLTPLPYRDGLEQTGSIQDVHDPVLAREGNRYYLYSTGYGIPIRMSDDLIAWSGPTEVFSELPSWAETAVPGVEFPWAPDISFFNGAYHLYYSLSTFGSQHSIIGLATNETLDPAGLNYEWVDRGKVVESAPGVTNYNAIDPNVAFDEAGQPWLAWGSFWDGIKLRRLDSDTGLLSSTDETVHSLARRPVESAIEAPFIIRRGSTFYLFVSFDSCCQGATSTYRIMVGRSPSITGPYVDRDGIAMASGGGTAVLEGYGRIAGPGHNAVYQDGDHYFLVHHFYDADANGVPKLQVRSLLWGDDGWPLAGEPYDGDFPTEPAGSTPTVTGKWAHSVDKGPPYEIEVKAGGMLERCRGEGSWSQDGTSLTLNWTKGGYPEESLQVSTDGSWYVGRTGEGLLIRGNRIQ